VTGSSREDDGVATVTNLLVIRGQASRDSMFQHAPGHLDDPAVAIDGVQASYDKLEDYLIAFA
jgi:hypothetical protein